MSWELGQVVNRNFHSASIYGQGVWIVGGKKNNVVDNEIDFIGSSNKIISFPLNQAKILGTKPPSRFGHSSVILNFRTQNLVTFGGTDEKQIFSDLYLLNLKTLTWTKPTTTGQKPSARSCHLACQLNNKESMIIFGGRNNKQVFNDLFVFHLKSKKWDRVVSSGQVPSGRFGLGGGIWGTNLVIFGGSDNVNIFNDVWVLDLNTLVWSVFNTTNSISSRRFFGCCVLNDRLYVCGGEDKNGVKSDCYYLDLSSRTWYVVPNIPTNCSGSTLTSQNSYLQLVNIQTWILDTSKLQSTKYSADIIPCSEMGDDSETSSSFSSSMSDSDSCVSSPRTFGTTSGGSEYSDIVVPSDEAPPLPKRETTQQKLDRRNREVVKYRDQIGVLQNQIRNLQYQIQNKNYPSDSQLDQERKKYQELKDQYDELSRSYSEMRVRYENEKTRRIQIEKELSGAEMKLLELDSLLTKLIEL